MVDFPIKSQLRNAFSVILDKFGIEVLHTKVNLTDATTGFYSDTVVSESTTTWYNAVFSERNQKLMMEKYGDFQDGDCEFSFDQNADINLNDFIETDSRKYEVRQVTDRQDGNTVYKDIWARLVKQDG